MKTDRKNWLPVRLIPGQNHCIMQPTLTDRDRDIVQNWIRAEGLGEHVTAVEPLTGGTQNIVVRLHIDDRPVVLLSLIHISEPTRQVR